MSIDPSELMPEAEFALQMGASLDVLRRARAEHLQAGEHFVTQGRLILLTPAGRERLLGAGLELRKKQKGGGPARVAVVVCAVGDRTLRRRVLRGRVKDSGAICTVFLTGRGVLARQFQVRQELACVPRPERVDAYEFDGRPSKRQPL